MKSNTKKSQLTMAILFFVVSFSGFLFLYTNIKNKEVMSEQKLSEWRVETARRDEIKALDSAIKNIENEKAMLETHFASIANPVTFLDTLEDLAESVGTEIKFATIDKALLVDMNISGTFENFYKFLTLLENWDYEVEFLSVDVKREGEISGKWSAIMKIRLLTFVQ